MFPKLKSVWGGSAGTLWWRPTLNLAIVNKRYRLNSTKDSWPSSPVVQIDFSIKLSSWREFPSNCLRVGFASGRGFGTTISKRGTSQIPFHPVRRSWEAGRRRTRRHCATPAPVQDSGYARSHHRWPEDRGRRLSCCGSDSALSRLSSISPRARSQIQLLITRPRAGL